MDEVSYLPQGASRDVLTGSPEQVPPAQALDVELLVGVTTYGRPEACADLVASLHGSLVAAGLGERAFVVVVRDTSDHDYGEALRRLERCFPGRFVFYEGERWLGKPGRYRTYQVLFDCMRALGAEHALLLEDDVSLPADFVERALAAYRGIEDPHKLALYLACFEDDEPDGRWVRFARERVRYGLPDTWLRKTQWLDLHAFIAGRRFFELLHWNLWRPHRWRWVGNAARSSGVSEQFTLRLWGRGNIYQVEETLAFHGRAPSILNVAARGERALNNFPDPRA